MPFARGLLRHIGALVPLVSHVLVAGAFAVDPGPRRITSSALQRPPRTPISTRTPTHTPTPTRTPAILTYVLTDESRLSLYYGTRPPSLSEPLTGRMEVVAREGTADDVFEFDIRRIELRSRHYEFSARAGTLRVSRRHRRVATSMQAVLRIHPSPVGGTVDSVRVEFNGGSAPRFSRYPPSLRDLTISGPERPPPFQFILRIFAEPQ